jgi:hypothetical protein
MKSFKYYVIVIAFFVCNISFSQPIHRTVTGTIDSYDFGGNLGVVSGTYTYHFMYKLDEYGFIESVHWNIRNVDLQNDKGQKLRMIDSGLDTYGVLWEFWNTPTKSNADQGYPEFSYNVDDYWLNSVMPAQMPPEGVYVNMNARLQLKNERYSLGMLWIVNFNANGDPVVDFMKFR